MLTVNQRLGILPRSHQRPVAVVEGSLTESVNETGVRLWIDPSVQTCLEEHTFTVDLDSDASAPLRR
jgi:hypothetical protein